MLSSGYGWKQPRWTRCLARLTNYGLRPLRLAGFPVVDLQIWRGGTVSVTICRSYGGLTGSQENGLLLMNALLLSCTCWNWQCK